MPARILLVEPDESVQVFLKSLLQAAGHSVTTATYVDEVHDALAGDGPDLVLVADVQTGIDGFMLCRTLRSGGLTAPIVMLVAQSDESATAKALGMGATAVLPKPISADDFSAHIADFLKERLS